MDKNENFRISFCFMQDYHDMHRLQYDVRFVQYKSNQNISQ